MTLAAKDTRDSTAARPSQFRRTEIAPPAVAVIEPRCAWQLLDGKELYQYRDLFRFLVWRNIKVRYAQSAIGIGWAVIQPVFSMLLFTVVFGNLVQVESDGVPYFLFAFAALVPWTYFANALNDGTGSLVNNAQMLSKVYFPRLLLPLSAVVSNLLDFVIALLLLFGLMAFRGVAPTWGALLLPGLVALMVLTAAALAVWLTALAVQYRDVKHAMHFVIQLLMYLAPVVYPASLVPERFQLLYAVNPMVGVIEGCRAALLGTRPMPWHFLAVGTASALALAVSGMLFFRHKERVFADVV
jgi:lipopolysaccharide transport system permease protein